MAPLSVVDALFDKPYLWDQHGTYQSWPQKVIVKIQKQWYGTPERQPRSTVVMTSTKQTKKLINHAQKFSLIMIKPQHSRKTAATSRLTNQRSSQQQMIDNILEEYQNIFQAPDRVPLHCVAIDINSSYDIYQTNKEAYQSCSKVHINHDRASVF